MTSQTIHSPRFDNQPAARPTIPSEDLAEVVLAAKLMRAEAEVRDRTISDLVLKSLSRRSRSYT